MPRITKVKFLEILKDLTDNFKKENLKTDSKSIAKAFIALQSYVATTTSEKQFPKERIEKLYNALFSKIENGEVVEKPMRTYDGWCERVNKLVSRNVTEGEFRNFSKDINEYDDVSFDYDYFVKELIRDLILGSAASGFFLAGNAPLAAASIAVPAMIHGLNNELDKRGKGIDRDLFKKLFNKFRDTFGKLVNDMQKYIDNANYSEEQLDLIESSAKSIYTWWKNNASNVEKDWNKFSDNKVVEFMNMYNTFISNVNYDIEHLEEKREKMTSDSIVKMLEQLEEDVKQNSSDKKKLAEVFITIVSMTQLIYEADSNMKILDSKVSELYDTIFSDYNEYGKKLKNAPMSYEAMKSFIERKNAEINKEVGEAVNSMKESEIYEAFDWIKKKFSKAATQTKGVTSYAFNTLIFEIALYGKWALTGVMSIGPVIALLARRFSYYAAEDAGARIMEKLFKNVKTDKVQKKIISIIEEIKSEIMKNADAIDEALKNNANSIEKSMSAVKINAPTNEKFSMMSFDQFLNESKKVEELDEGFASKFLTGVALISSLIGGKAKAQDPGSFSNAMKSAATTTKILATEEKNVSMKLNVNFQKSHPTAKGKIVVKASDIALSYGLEKVVFKSSANVQCKTMKGLPAQMSFEQSLQNGMKQAENVVTFNKTSEDNSIVEIGKIRNYTRNIQLFNPKVVEDGNVEFEVAGL